MQNLSLNESRFLDLLRKLIALGPRLQNGAAAGLVPEERLAASLVLETLKPHIDRGVIQAEALAAPGFEARPSLVLTYPGETRETLGLVGAHFDVVPADQKAEHWERDPFTLWVGEDGTLYGRGVTDCLGHIAVLTDLLAQLAETNRRPRRTVKVVMIANEEAAPVSQCGLDYVVDQGHMDDLKSGPVYWLDSADFGPTVGTGGIIMWSLEATGVAGHSGMAHNCVNAFELAMAASLALVKWFEQRFPAHTSEERWGFLCPSSLKATLAKVPNDQVTKIPGTARIDGDIRLTPFYEIEDALAGAAAFVADLDRQIRSGVRPPGFPAVKTVSGQTGSIKFQQNGRMMEGIACSLDSPGLHALRAAISKVRGQDQMKQFSLTGSLPLVRDLQRRGFDIQITGFGRSSYYHAPNEQANLEHFRDGFAILRELVNEL